MEKEQILEELLTKISYLEKQNETLDDLVADTQHKLYGIQSVLTSLMSGACNESIDYDTFKSATGVALDSLDTTLNNINNTL